MGVATAYVSSLFGVFIILVLARVLWSYFPSRPVTGWLRAIHDFVHESTGWFLAPFRRIIPPLGPVDLSPAVALIVLFVLRGVAVSLMGGG